MMEGRLKLYLNVYADLQDKRTFAYYCFGHTYYVRLCHKPFHKGTLQVTIAAVRLQSWNWDLDAT